MMLHRLQTNDNVIFITVIVIIIFHSAVNYTENTPISIRYFSFRTTRYLFFSFIYIFYV